MEKKRKTNPQMALVSCNPIFFFFSLLNISVADIDYINGVISLLSFSNSCQSFFGKNGNRVDGSQPMVHNRSVLASVDSFILKVSRHSNIYIKISTEHCILFI